MGIKLVDVERRPMSRELVVAARVDYEQNRIAQLTSRVPGTVWRVEKNVGQFVRRGEVLAVIDSMQVGKAKADLLHALIDAEAQQRIYDRLSALEAGSIPMKQVEAAKVELRKARFDLFTAQQTLINLGLPVDPNKVADMPEDQLLSYITLLGLPDSLAKSLDAKTSTANLLPMFAPFDGTVIRQDIVKGEVVELDKTSFEIADVSRMLIRLNVREENAGMLRVGQHVTFQGGDAEVSTTISWISTEVDLKTRTVEARCLADNPQLLEHSEELNGPRLLRANLFGTARIRVEEKSEAMVVPTEAVQTHGKSQVVFVQTGDAAFEMRAVEIGIETEKLTEILAGVRTGEAVAVEGSHVLKAEASRRQIPEETFGLANSR